VYLTPVYLTPVYQRRQLKSSKVLSRHAASTSIYREFQVAELEHLKHIITIRLYSAVQVGSHWQIHKLKTQNSTN